MGECYPNALPDHLENLGSTPSRFIPEFVSRLPSITTLAPLTIPDLRRILTEVKGSLIAQYQALFRYSGVDLRFTSTALDAVCKKAIDRGGGARGLRGIMVGVNPFYDATSQSAHKLFPGNPSARLDVRGPVS